MSNPLRPSRELMLAAEIVRVLGSAAWEHPSAMRMPEREVATICNDDQDYSVTFTNDDEWPRLRRHAERIAVTMFFSVWYGELFDPIEVADGDLAYKLRVGPCGDGLCCGPTPLLPDQSPAE